MIAGTRPKNLATKIAQTGLDELLNRDTMIYAHKGEHARITPKNERGGGGFAGIVNVGPIYLDGEQIYGKMSYRMGKNQSTYK